MFDWKITYGNQEIKITAQDLVETLGRTLGFMYYKLENDEKIKGHVQMKIIHEMDIQILELMKAQFLGAVEESRRHNVSMKIVGKNPDRKRTPGHAVQGKPGDVVEITPKKED